MFKFQNEATLKAVFFSYKMAESIATNPPPTGSVDTAGDETKDIEKSPLPEGAEVKSSNAEEKVAKPPPRGRMKGSLPIFF